MTSSANVEMWNIVCCELPIRYHVDKCDSSFSTSENVFTSSEHKDSEDAEHFDSHKLIGLLCTTSEPAILLACKEVSQEYLPF